MTWENVRWWFGLAVAALGAWWVGLSAVLQALLVLMTIDIASGMAAALVSKTLDSSIGWRGVARKVLTLMLVTMAGILEPLVSSALASYLGAQPGVVRVPLGEGAALYFSAIEGLSILENASRAGVPIPKILRDALSKLKAAGGDEPPAAPEPHG